MRASHPFMHCRFEGRPGIVHCLRFLGSTLDLVKVRGISWQRSRFNFPLNYNDNHCIRGRSILGKAGSTTNFCFNQRTSSLTMRASFRFFKTHVCFDDLVCLDHPVVYLQYPGRLSIISPKEYPWCPSRITTLSTACVRWPALWIPFFLSKENPKPISISTESNGIL